MNHYKTTPTKALVLFCAPALLAPVAAGAATVPLEVVREESRIEARVQATGHAFEAVVTDYELEITRSAETGEIESAHLSFDFADVETGRERRDREMREWLDYDSHPEFVFRLDRIEPADDASVLAIGTVTLHGVDQPIAIPVNIEVSAEAVRIQGRTVLDHRDWKLERIRAFLFMTVDPELDVTFDILLRPPNGSSPD